MHYEVAPLIVVYVIYKLYYIYTYIHIYYIILYYIYISIYYKVAPASASAESPPPSALVPRMQGTQSPPYASVGACVCVCIASGGV